jgi:ATP-dependent helicase HepA
MGAGILARIPAELDALNEHVVATVCARLGFNVEHTRGRRTFAIELGNESLVDNLPGVPGGSSYIGSFDREEAVEDESIDFFASGHPLVEGVFAHMEDSPMGRVVWLELENGSDHGFGLVAIYKDGPGFDVVARDHSGRERPEWAAVFRRRPLAARRFTVKVDEQEWTESIRRLTTRLDPDRRPQALAAVIVRPEQ